MTGTRAGRRPTRTGLRRGSLTQELIVKESLRLLDERGTAGFSLPKLGRALGADPTAVYRHFASKDDLVLAIADHLIEEAMGDISPRECWVDTVIEVARRLRRTYRAHPAAAALSACRTTQRPAEMRIVNVLIGAVLDAGFEGPQAALIYRALGDFVLSWAGAKRISYPWTSVPKNPTVQRGHAPISASALRSTRTSGESGKSLPVSRMMTSSRPSCRLSLAGSSGSRRAPATARPTRRHACR